VTRLGFFTGFGVSDLSAGILRRMRGRHERARRTESANGDAKRLCSKFLVRDDMGSACSAQAHKARLAAPAASFLTEGGKLHESAGLRALKESPSVTRPAQHVGC